MPSGKRSQPAQLLGILLDRTFTAAEYADPISGPIPRLGTRVLDEDGNEYVFVKAGGTITVSTPVKIAAGLVATVSGNAGVVFGVSHVAIASGSYGFVQTRGVVDSNVEDALAAGALLAGTTDANGDLQAIDPDVGHGIRGVCLVTEDATEIVSVHLF